MDTKKTINGMGCLLALSMAVTEGLLIWQGRWREAIPLHLCSISALLAFAASIGIAKRGMIDFLWYAGVPGALLALVFPAPAASGCQMVFNASYTATHLLIILIPLLLMRRGICPRKGRCAHVMLALQGIAFVALLVNETLSTNFLFLSFPPAGTPLESIYRFGAGAYYLFLEAMMLAICLIQGGLLRTVRTGDRRMDD